MNRKKELLRLYREATGRNAAEAMLLTGSGSNRQYFLLSDSEGNNTLIGTIGESAEENRSFICLDRHFRAKGINVPEVIATNSDQSVYLQQYLGNTSLFDAIASGRTTGNFSPIEISLLERAIRALPKIQYIGAEDLDWSLCYPVEAFDRRTVMWDLNYFKYCFLKTSGIDFNEARLEDDFEGLCSRLLEEDPSTFMYRDFQSRNVMIHNGEPWLIDFQGGRRGPSEYDVASFLWQARANIPSDLREHLIDCYIDAASQYTTIDADKFRRRMRHFVLFRMMQVLGAYGFRGLHERKQHFIDSIPPALRNLRDLMKEPMTEYPTITAVLELLYDKYLTESKKANHLTVTVMSFSYRKGIPTDKSGNGGGFVFDCRGMHNPGRYDEYRKLTGRDREVIDFLEERGEVQPYLSACFTLVDKSIETYVRRGFTSLMACFGCTGGQHRSVYCADRLTDHITTKYPEAEVRLIHREHPEIQSPEENRQ